MLNGDTKEIDKNFISWSVTAVSSTKIDISLTFEKSISVSTGDSSDILLIQVSLDVFTDNNGYRLPPALVKFRQIPIQISSVEHDIQPVDYCLAHTYGRHQIFRECYANK